MSAERSVAIPEALPIKGSLDDAGNLLARFNAARSIVIAALRKCPALLDLARVRGQALYTVALPTEALAGLSKRDLAWNVRPDGTLPAVLRDADSNAIAQVRRGRRSNSLPWPPSGCLSGICYQRRFRIPKTSTRPKSGAWRSGVWSQSSTGGSDPPKWLFFR